MGTTAVADLDLARDGVTVVEDVLDAEMVAALSRMADAQLAAQPDEHFDAFKFHGSMLPLDLQHGVARNLVAWKPALAALARCGFGDPKWLSGYVIAKPPGSPSLWWHQDWWAWGEPDSFAAVPPQVFVMYYLTDVDVDNGCLRVIPGSHRSAHPLHRELPEAHSEQIGRTRPDDVAHRRRDEEVAVKARAGSAVIGDVRVLHATHPNASTDRRTCLTLWYLPEFERLSAPLRSYVVNHPALPPAGWWNDDGADVPSEVRDLLPVYEGDAPPASYCRSPPIDWPSG